eukprot:1901423-Prymnesium_polylepis.1
MIRAQRAPSADRSVLEPHHPPSQSSPSACPSLSAPHPPGSRCERRDVCAGGPARSGPANTITSLLRESKPNHISTLGSPCGERHITQVQVQVQGGLIESRAVGRGCQTNPLAERSLSPRHEPASVT